MRIKKFLRKQAAQTHEALREQGAERLNGLERQSGAPARRSLKGSAVGFSCALALLIAGGWLTAALYAPAGLQGDVGEKPPTLYGDSGKEPTVFERTDLAEVNASLQDLSLQFSGRYSSVVKYSDAESGEALYYRISLLDDAADYSLYLRVPIDADRGGAPGVFLFGYAELDGYRVRYNVYGGTENNGVAAIRSEHDTIYVYEYHNCAAPDAETFLSLLSATIRRK